MTRDSGGVLLFRRQFVVGPLCRRVSVRDTGSDPTRPDPDEPAASDRDILNGLLPSARDSRSLFRELSRLGGGFVVLVDTGADTVATSDSLGFRFYVEDARSGEFWCASQPALLGERRPLAPDPEALGYLGACESQEYWWPGRRTVYRGVFRLLPNRVLDLRTRLVRRYWPDSPIAPQTVAEAVEGCVPRMQGLLKSAHNRFPLAQTVTAGLDSRLSFAASRHIAKDVTSPLLTTLKVPTGFTLDEFNAELKRAGYIVYRGKDHLEERVFQVANMGALTPELCDAFLAALERVIKGAG
jgi:hypothetical protein